MATSPPEAGIIYKIYEISPAKQGRRIKNKEERFTEKKYMTINNSINQLKFNVMMKKVLMSFVALAAIAAAATGHG